MKILSKSLDFIYKLTLKGIDYSVAAALLVSATCQGNDGKSCPLFHGSLGPTMFSRISWDTGTTLQMFLLLSNNITWVNAVYFPENAQDAQQMIETFSQTRYFCRSVKKISVDCKTFFQINGVKEFVKTHLAGVEVVDFRKRIQHCNDFVIEEFVCHMTQLRELDLAFSEVTADCFPALKPLTHLRHINLEMCTRVHDEDLEATLPALVPSLQSLNFNFCEQLGDQAMEAISQVTSLRRLNLSRLQKIRNAGVQALATLPQLEYLDLSLCTQFDHEGIAHLALHNFPKTLTTLLLNDCQGISDECLLQIGKLVKLRMLDLNECLRITHAGIAHLSNLVNLETLDLTSCRKVGDPGFQVLGQLPALQHLTLDRFSGLSDKALEYLSASKSLEKLKIAGSNNITDTGIFHLSQTSAPISHLDVESSKLTESAMIFFSKLSKLHSLEIVGITTLTSKGLAHLTKLPLLKNLSLANCGVDDSAVQQLSKMKSLRQLHLVNCDKITTACFEYLMNFEHLALFALTRGLFSRTQMDELKKHLSSSTRVLITEA
jgi:hypothetical protein